MRVDEVLQVSGLYPVAGYIVEPYRYTCDAQRREVSGSESELLH